MEFLFCRHVEGWTFKPERAMTVFNDGYRVIVKGEGDNVILNGSRWLYEKMWQKGWFRPLPENFNSV